MEEDFRWRAEKPLSLLSFRSFFLFLLFLLLTVVFVGDWREENGRLASFEARSLEELGDGEREREGSVSLER